MGCQNYGAVSTNDVLRCFANPNGLNCEDLLEGIIPKPVSWLTL
jgi:hypothetical protein